MVAKVQVCISIDKIRYDKYVEISNKTGLAVSKIIELELSGYEVTTMKKEITEV